MGVVVDSSVLITLERRDLSVRALQPSNIDEPWAVAAVTISELLFGYYRAQTLQQRLRREEFVQSTLVELSVLPFDLAVARVHAQIWSDLTGDGLRIGAHDFMIAATALAHGYDLLTENLREFRRVTGLLVREPNW